MTTTRWISTCLTVFYHVSKDVLDPLETERRSFVWTLSKVYVVGRTARKHEVELLTNLGFIEVDA